MKIAGTLPCSFVNGDGTRFVIFTQGCNHRCKGCQNPETWDFDGGMEISVEELVEQIKANKYIDGITLSGGDPFYHQDECVKLLELLPDINVWAYTGFRYEDIADTPLAKMCDVIVDGEYVENLKCTGQMYGSTNQRIIRKGKNYER